MVQEICILASLYERGRAVAATRHRFCYCFQKAISPELLEFLMEVVHTCPGV